MKFLQKWYYSRMLNKKWRKSAMDRLAGDSPAELSLTVSPIFQLLMSYGPEAVDLRGLYAHRVNGMHMAAMLGATFAYKNEIVGWRDAMITTRMALSMEGKDWQDALAGLDEDS